MLINTSITMMLHIVLDNIFANDVDPIEWLNDVLPKLARINYNTEEGKTAITLLLPDEGKKSI